MSQYLHLSGAEAPTRYVQRFGSRSYAALKLVRAHGEQVTLPVESVTS